MKEIFIKTKELSIFKNEIFGDDENTLYYKSTITVANARSLCEQTFLKDATTYKYGTKE